MGEWASSLRAALWLSLSLQRRFYEGGPQLCLQARGGGLVVVCEGVKGYEPEEPDHKLSASRPTQP